MKTLTTIRTEIYHPLVIKANEASNAAWKATKKATTRLSHIKAESFHNEAVRLHKEAMKHSPSESDKEDHQHIINKHSNQATFHASNSMS